MKSYERVNYTVKYHNTLSNTFDNRNWSNKPNNAIEKLVLQEGNLLEKGNFNNQWCTQTSARVA